MPRDSAPLVETLQCIAEVDDDPVFDLKQESSRAIADSLLRTRMKRLSNRSKRERQRAVLRSQSGGAHPRYVHRIPSIHRNQLRRTVRERETTNDGSVRLGNHPIGVPVVIRISVRNQDMGNGTPDLAWDDRSEAEVVELASRVNRDTQIVRRAGIDGLRSMGIACPRLRRRHTFASSSPHRRNR